MGGPGVKRQGPTPAKHDIGPIRSLALEPPWHSLVPPYPCQTFPCIRWICGLSTTGATIQSCVITIEVDTTRTNKPGIQVVPPAPPSHAMSLSATDRAPVHAHHRGYTKRLRPPPNPAKSGKQYCNQPGPRKNRPMTEGHSETHSRQLEGWQITPIARAQYFSESDRMEK